MARLLLPDNRNRAIVLTPRDVAIIDLIHRYGGCTVDQIHHKFWHPEGVMAPCYRRIALLIKSGYLRARRLPSLSGVGSGKAFLDLGPAARPLLAELQGIRLRDLPRLATPPRSLFHIAHHLAICDVRLSLELACERDGAVTLESFTTETELRRSPLRITVPSDTPGSGQGRTATLVPDGAFTLRHAGKRQRCYLEVDMDTMRSPRMRQKVRMYLARRGQDATIPVLLVTTDEGRVDQLITLAIREGARVGANPTVFFLTTFAQVSDETMLRAEIWRQPGSHHSVALIPRGQD